MKIRICIEDGRYIITHKDGLNGLDFIFSEEGSGRETIRKKVVEMIDEILESKRFDVFDTEEE